MTILHKKIFPTTPEKPDKIRQNPVNFVGFFGPRLAEIELGTGRRRLRHDKKAGCQILAGQ